MMRYLSRCPRTLRLGACCTALLATIRPAGLFAANTAQLEIRVVDAASQEPIAVRMHLKNAKGTAVVPKDAVGWKDHFVFAGSVVLDLPPGKYTFELERGPEYVLRRGSFELKRGDRDSQQLDLKRFVDMKREQWWSGDLHIHRAVADLPLLMLADDLHVAPAVTWWNENNAWRDGLPERLTVPVEQDRFYNVMAGEDERGGGALLYFGLSRPLPITGARREYPSSVEFLLAAKEQQPSAHVDVEKPFWWDLPLWLATGKVDSIGIAHNHMWRDGVLANEAWGKTRDTLCYPDPLGNGQWTQQIYYQILDCGIRLPPSAGSASGVLPNPVGYNRVYVQVEGELTYEKWWEGLRAGRVVVTNGPMLRPRVNGEWPGHVFRAEPGQSVKLQPELTLSLREKVEYLEIVKDGKVAHEVRLDEYAKAGGQLPPVTFDRSGWLMVRAVTNHPRTYRFAASGPFYVEIGHQPRISRAAVEFFLEWLAQREQALQLDDPPQRSQVLRYFTTARAFWQQKLLAANAE